MTLLVLVAAFSRRTRPSFVRSCWLLLLTLCVLPSNVSSAQNPSKIDGGSLGILADTGVHQKKVIDFEREVVESIVAAFENVATESFL